MKAVYRIYALSPKNPTPKYLGMVWADDEDQALDNAKNGFPGWRLKGSKLQAEYACATDKPKD
jgi:hypothetical protein